MEHKTYFNNSKGEKICGIIAHPNKEDTKTPIIVMCHGFSTNKSSSSTLRLQEKFHAQGMAVFRFDFYGHGESDGKFEDITLSEAVDDANEAITFLKYQGYRKIALFGSSFGGMVALLTAVDHPELFALALKAPVSDYIGKLVAQGERYPIAQWKKEGFIYYSGPKEEKLKLNYSFYEDAEKHSGYAIAENVNLPTVIVHGDADESVPVAQSKKTAQLIPDCRLEIIKGADHRFSKEKDFAHMAALFVGFFAEHTK